MEERSAIIIGAGVAGLATGCYAQMNGYRTQIVEMAERPGGVCTSWHRHGYTFDGCLQWLMGSRPGSFINTIWQELGALAGRKVVDHDEYMRIEGRDGETLIVYTDAGRLERHLCELSPDDAALSRAFCDAIRRIAAFDRAGADGYCAPAAVSWLQPVLGLLPAAPHLIGSLGLTWQQFCARYTNRFLRDALRPLGDLPDFPYLGVVAMLAWMHARDAGYPIGGSLAFAQGIEQRYRELGGEVIYGARVEKILVENSRATGVRLADGREIHASDVISAADGHTTVFELLDGHYLDAELSRRYANPRLFTPLVQVSLGVARDLSAEPHFLQFPLLTPARIAGRTRETLAVRHYGYDPTLAPAGKSVLQVLLDTGYDAWAELARDPGRYSAEKQAIAEAVIAALDSRFPGLAEQVEIVDVATPVTWVRHTGNWRGSYEGWLPDRRAFISMVRGSRSTLPGLERFAMVGQWVNSGGGLPNVAPAGRNLIKRLCKRDGRPFVTSVATHPPAHLLPQFGAVEVAESPQSSGAPRRHVPAST